jgi:hypothetical protein
LSTSPARITCDQCAAEVVARNAAEWLHLTPPPASHPLFDAPRGALCLDFCSWKCLHGHTVTGLPMASRLVGTSSATRTLDECDLDSLRPQAAPKAN